MEGTLTKFDGIHFSKKKDFYYLEGKRILKLARAALVSRGDLRSELGVVADAMGRGAITGSQSDYIWDFLRLWPPGNGDAQNKYPHLTFAIGRYEAKAMVTVSSKADGAIQKRLQQLGKEEFQKLIEDILKRLQPLLRREQGAVPWFSGIQRHSPHRGGDAIVDARIEFDLRASVPDGDGPKYQPLWLAAGYGSLVRKRGANHVTQVGVRFPYDRCTKLAEPQALDLIAEAWLACKPLIDLARGG